MQDFQQRVIDEKGELDIKIQKLKKFLKDSDGNRVVTNDEYSRLLRQLNVMERYSDVLSERIENFVTEPIQKPDIEKYYARMRKTLVNMVGESEPEELKKMKEVILSGTIGAPPEYVEVTVEAIDILIETAE